MPRFRARHAAALVATMAALLAASPAMAGEAVAAVAPVAAGLAQPACAAGNCDYRLSATQLLVLAERLVTERKYDEARPLVAALAAAPDMATPYDFLEGLIALETGDAKGAARHFRSILDKDPSQTRVRLELARALFAQGNVAAADYHLRIAQQADDLPPDIARAISGTRTILRSKRNWTFGFDVGLAPDTNINSATSAETIDVNFGPLTLPLTLDPEARARSGTGVTANMFGSLRLPAAENASIVVDFDASMVNYKGSDVDDYSVQLAAGPEWRLSPRTSVTVQGVGLYRWFAGKVAARQAGAKLTFQHDLSRSQRMGFQIDGRHSGSDYGPGFTGWQLSAIASYDQVVMKSAIASVSVFARRDIMDFAPNSNTTIGVGLGLGGELPLGINAGISGNASYSRYDEPQYFFSLDRREDWRYQARLYAGMRKIRVMGFSPSVEYRFMATDTNYELYQSERHRFNFKLARYF